MKLIVCSVLFINAVIGSDDASAAIYPTMSGTIIDAIAGKPVKGAIVLAYWTKSVLRPPIEAGSELIEARLVESDSDGRYRIDGIVKLLGPLEFKGDTVLVVYQPGYVAHIEQEFRDGSKEINKDANLIKLERIPANFDHGKHYDEIEHALWGIDDHSYMLLDGSVSWSSVKRSALKGLPEKEILLRRAYWEEERSRRKYEQ